MKFAAQVGAWASESKERLSAVHKRSVELLADEMRTTDEEGGRVPFLDGHLARSLLASTNAMPKTSLLQTSGDDVGVVIAKLKIDQSIWLGYSAIYARRQNYGFVGKDAKERTYNQDGHYFVEYAIDMWQTIVDLAVEDTRANTKVSSPATT